MITVCQALFSALCIFSPFIITITLGSKLVNVTIVNDGQKNEGGVCLPEPLSPHHTKPRDRLSLGLFSVPLVSFFTPWILFCTQKRLYNLSPTLWNPLESYHWRLNKIEFPTRPYLTWPAYRFDFTSFPAPQLNMLQGPGLWCSSASLSLFLLCGIFT